ncbi:MAG: exo-alpha-sialidase, partial [Clostridia bacterium]|nr:exo-alpha-sialidase [Clostridia bacterium]
MKRIMALALSAAMLFSGTAYAAAAYNTPFERNTLGCSEYRIPALLTLKDGSVCASADMRWSHGKDSPQNIDTVFAKSPDGLGDWKYTVVNKFDDYADGESSANSASFIDSALLQSENGTL